MGKPIFISDTLTHWTGRNKSEEAAFSILEKIISTKKLLLTFCPNYPKLIADRQLETMMVCFTDIPLHLSKVHCERFGKFGIGFSKSVMMGYGANPVLYTTNEMNQRVESFISLVHRLYKEEIDREWRDSTLNGDEGDRYQFTSDQFFAMSELVGFMQNYQYSDNSIDYYQREWRINYATLPQVSGVDIQVVPGQGAMDGYIGEDLKFKLANSMLFDLNDIDYVVVPYSYKEKAERLISGIEAQVKIYEEEVG